MALSLSWNTHLVRTMVASSSTVVNRQTQNQRGFSVSVRAQGGEGSPKANRVWRRRKMKRKDPGYYDVGRTPFLEERIIKLRDPGLHMIHDINRMLLSEGKYDLCNQIIDDANKLLEENEQLYGHKKPVLHALSNRINETGYVRRPEAYVPPNPLKISNSIRDQPKFLDD